MFDVTFSGLLGAAGAACSALFVLPQFLKERRQRERHRPGTSTRRLRIAIDMDEVMADALSEHLRRYNTVFGTSLTATHLQGCHLEDCVPTEHRSEVEAMIDASFFEDLVVLPDCRAVVLELAQRYEVFIVSAAMDVPCSFDAKYRWLRRHFPFIPPTHIVFCGDKSVVDADYLIDDRARHFARFTGKPLLFSAPHNAGETRYQRVASWKDVRDVFARIESRRD
jgi:5'-nucleotidase